MREISSWTCIGRARERERGMARTHFCEKTGVKKGPWTAEEDQILVDFIRKNGHGSWRALPQKADIILFLLLKLV